MSFSLHTEPERMQARRNFRECGDACLPRIVCRKPRPGDVALFKPSTLQTLIRTISPRYVVGLKKIEVLPRRRAIGQPWGDYVIAEKKIRIYSLPLDWGLMQLSPSWQRGLAQWGADVRPTGGSFEVIWPSVRKLAIWYFDIVFLHELGHHYTYMYRRKRVNVARLSVKANEHLANLGRDRILCNRDEFFPEDRVPELSGCAESIIPETAEADSPRRHGSTE